MADRYPCVTCRKDVAKTKNDHYRSHSGGDGEPCPSAATPIPEHVLANGPVDGKAPADVPVEGVDYAKCPQCTRNVELTRLGYFEPHDQTLRGGDRCPVSGVRMKHARSIDDRLLPGDQPASAEPKVKDSSTPVANRGASPTSEKGQPATDTSSPTDLTPGQLDRLYRATAEPTWREGAQTDWSKVGDLEHLPETDQFPPNDPDNEFSASMSEGDPYPAPVPDAASSASTAASSPESTTTSQPSFSPPSGAELSPEPRSGSMGLSSTPSGSKQPDLTPPTSSAAGEGPAAAGPFHLAPLLDGVILQPFSHISQPFPVPVKLKVSESMTDRGKEIAARLRETFYAYTNRNASDNRSAQRTLGPSEIGSPCDRQIAMKLLGVKPANPQEGWAPFVGTAVHVELAKMFEWANGAGSGRYITEMPLEFGHPLVPRGTGDLFDRTMCLFLDHKLMGRWSLDKLVQSGPSETYRIQVQVYGLGAELAGEKVKEVAIIGWPRQETSLDKLYVHVEPYDRKLAEAALARVTRIAEDVRFDPGPAMMTAQRMSTGDDCKWCPFHLKGDKEMKRGCPGK